LKTNVVHVCCVICILYIQAKASWNFDVPLGPVVLEDSVDVVKLIEEFDEGGLLCSTVDRVWDEVQMLLGLRGGDCNVRGAGKVDLELDGLFKE